ncbi:hypothetical protein BKA83DRAFT_4129265 [Pisolithus microcarpus]|nr:hypothetical protein BKA83DRAFT_4129265 [Pisolithus microcarpus]
MFARITNTLLIPLNSDSPTSSISQSKRALPVGDEIRQSALVGFITPLVAPLPFRLSGNRLHQCVQRVAPNPTGWYSCRGIRDRHLQLIRLELRWEVSQTREFHCLVAAIVMRVCAMSLRVWEFDTDESHCRVVAAIVRIFCCSFGTATEAMLKNYHCTSSSLWDLGHTEWLVIEEGQQLSLGPRMDSKSTFTTRKLRWLFILQPEVNVTQSGISLRWLAQLLSMLSSGQKEERRTRQMKLASDIASTQQAYAQEARDIAQNHGWSLKWTCVQLLKSQNLCDRRCINSWNAFIRAKLHEANAIAYKNLTPAQQEAYNAEVQVARDTKVMVMRSNPKAISHTVSAAFANMDWENASGLPSLHLESWAVSGLDMPIKTKHQHPLNKLISECHALIQEELDYLLMKKKVSTNMKMNYTNYKCQIVEHYGVMLTGWPFSGTVQNPSKIGGQAKVEKLLDALNSEACKWVRLTDEELRARVIHNKECQARGESVYHPRRTRTTKALTTQCSRTSSVSASASPQNNRLTHKQEREGRGRPEHSSVAQGWVAGRASGIRTTGQATMVDGDQDIETYYNTHTGAKHPWQKVRAFMVACTTPAGLGSSDKWVEHLAFGQLDRQP